MFAISEMNGMRPVNAENCHFGNGANLGLVLMVSNRRSEMLESEPHAVAAALLDVGFAEGGALVVAHAAP